MMGYKLLVSLLSLTTSAIPAVGMRIDGAPGAAAGGMPSPASEREPGRQQIIHSQATPLGGRGRLQIPELVDFVMTVGSHALY
jgi:hypothetical protein